MEQTAYDTPESMPERRLGPSRTGLLCGANRKLPNMVLRRMGTRWGGVCFEGRRRSRRDLVSNPSNRCYPGIGRHTVEVACK